MEVHRNAFLSVSFQLYIGSVFKTEITNTWMDKQVHWEMNKQVNWRWINRYVEESLTVKVRFPVVVITSKVKFTLLGIASTRRRNATSPDGRTFERIVPFRWDFGRNQALHYDKKDISKSIKLIFWFHQSIMKRKVDKT